MKTETAALVLSAIAALGLGIIGLTAAFLSNSQAILLDGLFNVAFFVTALLTLRVVQLLKRPDDARYPFGYLYFEPLINTVKGLLILGVSLFALIDALITLATGGRALVLGPALVYAAVATATCGLVTLVLRRAGRGLASPLVEADIGNWTVNTAISAGVFIAFVLAFVFERLALTTAARYVDPVLVGLVVLVSLGVPIRMAGRGLLALLNRAAPETVTTSIEAMVKEALAALPTRAIYLRVVQPGRTLYVTVHVLLDEAGADLDLRTADRLRVAVVEALARKHAPIIVDIVFTTIEEYAAPTTGFVAAPAQEGST